MVNERLPEMLWAVLLVRTCSTSNAGNLREVADYVSQFSGKIHTRCYTHRVFESKSRDCGRVANVITATDDHRVALSPLSLLHQLPAYESWTRFSCTIQGQLASTHGCCSASA
jgi:hypothetical protein